MIVETEQYAMRVETEKMVSENSMWLFKTSENRF